MQRRRCSVYSDDTVQFQTAQVFSESDIFKYGDYLYALYDDIIIPTELAGVYYKSAIKKRNRWLVDHSDFIIGYTIRNYGGAYEAIKYAMKSNKIVVKFGNPIN